ncbi:hypothetical protein AP1_0034 [Aeromonas phage AP1]|nr:hypothetical protein AP1_0034 [Aeromonas phage AP1]
MKFSRESGEYSVESRDILPIIDEHVRSRMEKHKSELNAIEDNEKFVIELSKLFVTTWSYIMPYILEAKSASLLSAGVPDKINKRTFQFLDFAFC